MASTAPTFNDQTTVTYNVTATYNYQVGVWTPATIAELRAIATDSTNKVAHLLNDGSDTYRFYKWNNTSTATDDGLSIIAPSDGGTGRWELQY